MVRLGDITNRTMTSDQSAREAFAQTLSKAAQRLKLFNFLWDHQDDDEKASAQTIGESVIRKPGAVEPSGHTLRSEINAAKTACGELRMKLEEFFDEERCWRHGVKISLPIGSSSESYQLKVEEIEDTATRAFWRPHLDGREPIPILFQKPRLFVDIKTGCYLRFTDTNLSTESGGFEALAQQHGVELKQLFKSVAAARRRLRPTRFYVGMGESAALESVERWFSDYPWVKVERKADHATEIESKQSPILLGSERSSRNISDLLKAAKCAYRLDSEKPFHIRIQQPRTEERQALAEFFNEDEIVDDADFLIAGRGLSIDAQRTRLVVLTRIPNIKGDMRPVTIISSDTTLAIEQVAAFVTEDDKVAHISASLGRLDGTFTPAFEVLFAVEITPGAIDDKAGPAKLLAAREISVAAARLR